MPDLFILKYLPQSVPLEPHRVAQLTTLMRLARPVSPNEVQTLAPNLMGSLLLVSDHPDIWLHIDAAWLGAAFSCPEYRERCRVPAVNKYADSLCVNFHKVWPRSFPVLLRFLKALHSGDWSAWTVQACGSEIGRI